VSRRIYLGRAYEHGNDPHGRVELYIDLHDWWIGLFYTSMAFYIIVIPTCVIRISRGRKPNAWGV
jgi:hypothetical protein